MMDDDLSRLSRSFGPVAEAYDRGRPDFPAPAAAWLVGRDAATVLELGAGTGKLTRQLVSLGHDVHATDPDPDMLGILQRHLPDVPTSVSGAEEIPLPDSSVDVVVAGQAFHWFEHERALPEIARVLRPGGSVAIAWNAHDPRIPWVRKLWRILGERKDLAARTEESAQALVDSELFGVVEETSFAFWQEVNRESIVDLVSSRSYVATLDADARDALMADVVELYEDYGRGMDGMRVPYTCDCFRATLVDTSEPVTEDPAPLDTPPGRASDGPDDDMLLIDFR